MGLGGDSMNFHTFGNLTHPTLYRKEGLQCLRQQLTGDELLVWTTETFTMFYSRTWAQSVILPLLGLIPLLLSIASFVYDYYSDVELTIEYYKNWRYVNPLGNFKTLQT